MNPNSAPTPYVQPAKGKFVAKGHDKQIEALQNTSTIVKVRRMGGEIDVGIIRKRDKFTLTLEHYQFTDHPDGFPVTKPTGEIEIIFKHDIAGIITLNKD